MQAKVTHGVQLGQTWPDTVCCRERRNPASFILVSAKSFPKRRSSPPLKCSYKNSTASTSSETDYYHLPSPETDLQIVSQKVKLQLNNRCLYLVGLMGSGKTTVGKQVSQALEYSFIDRYHISTIFPLLSHQILSDALIEQSAKGSSVREIFQTYGEPFFRYKETLVLKKLSAMRGLVVSTGGGAVIRPINWKYMRSGVVVWLDVPPETLARRVAAVGTESRPLLHREGTDPYEQALERLTALWEERSECYGNADARVSLERIAGKLGHNDVSCVAVPDIALEVLEKVEEHLQKEAL